MSKPSQDKAARRARRKAKRPPRRFRSAGGVVIPTTWAEDFSKQHKIHWAPVGEATCSCCHEPISMGRTGQTKHDRCEFEDKTTPESTGPVTITDSDGRKL